MNMQVSRVLGSPQWQLCQESWGQGGLGRRCESCAVDLAHVHRQGV